MKILNYNISNDKLLHFWGGYFLFTVAALVIPMFAAFALNCVVGIGKEVLRDKYLNMGTPDKYDAIATIAGGALAWVVVLLLVFKFS